MTSTVAAPGHVRAGDSSTGKVKLICCFIRRKLNHAKNRDLPLIELLVVIAVLMAILLPALQRVHKQARAVVCQNYLRQLGVIWNMYLNDYNNRFADDYLDHFNLTKGVTL